MKEGENFCIFVHYDKDNIYSPDDCNFIKLLSKRFDNLVVLTGNTNIGIKSNNIEYILKIPNIGYDFGKIQYYIEKEDLSNISNIYMFNNSCLLVRDLTPSIKLMKSKKLDFWGYTTSSSRDHIHIQSYFYYFNKKSFFEFSNFLLKTNPIKNNYSKEDVINNIEIKLTSYLEKQGVNWDAYIRTHELWPGRNPSSRLDYILKNFRDFPLIKKNLGIEKIKNLKKLI